MSENKKKPTTNNQKASNEKVNKVNAKNAKPETENSRKKKLSRNAIAAIISVSIILVIAIAVGIVFLVDYIKNDKGFDYLKSDLSKYVEFNGDYKNLELELQIAKPRPIDTDNAILAILAANKDKTSASLDDRTNADTVIGPGDVVYVYYRGYLLDSDGEKVYIPELSNLSNASAGSLEVGSGGFYPGVELEMVGMNTSEFPKYEKITSGRVETLADDCIVYISYTRFVTNGGDTENIKKETVTFERVDMSSDIDAIYGDQFRFHIEKAEIGESTWDIKNSCGDVNYQYTGVKVLYATESEKDPTVLSGYIPYDATQKDYRNRDVYFEVYVDGIIDYQANDTLTDEFVQKKIDDGTFGIKAEDLNEYEGEGIAQKYYNYVKKVTNDVYESDYEAFLEEAIWTKLLSMVNVKKYPVQKLEEIYNDYVYEVNYKYAESGGRIYNSDGTYTTYDTVDKYAEAYFGTSGYSFSWSDYCYLLAQNKVKERLLLFYILRTENVLPTDAELQSTYDATVEQYLNDYVNEALYYEGISKDSMTDEEYAKYVETCRAELFTLFDEEDFEETSYYLLLIDKIKEWPTIKVTTLDDVNSTPENK